MITTVIGGSATSPSSSSAQELAREEQPFLSRMFTLSSHHPYELPAEDAKRFAGGTQDIHPTLRYADDALRQFFATARTMPWYSNTLFVITADHTAYIDRSGQHYTKATDYWVPLLYYKAGQILPMQQPRVTQHIDTPSDDLLPDRLRRTLLQFRT